MSEFEDKLNAILSNPEAMAQVMGLAQSLNGSGTFDPSSQPQEKSAPSATQTTGPSSGIGDLFSQIDPRMIERLLPLLGELNSSGSDERMQLLYALRPFLKPERQDKVERAARAAKLIHIGKKFLTSMGEPYV